MSYALWKSVYNEYLKAFYKKMEFKSNDKYREERLRLNAKIDALYDAAAWLTNDEVPANLPQSDRAYFAESLSRLKELEAEALKSIPQKIYNELLSEATHNSYMADEVIFFSNGSGDKEAAEKLAHYRGMEERYKKAAELVRP